MKDCTGSCENCMKDSPNPYCCKLECGEHEFCRGCSIMYNKNVESAKKKSIEELMKEIGTDKTPTCGGEFCEEAFNKFIEEKEVNQESITNYNNVRVRK